jgi:hypothetical protein
MGFDLSGVFLGVSTGGGHRLGVAVMNYTE